MENESKAKLISIRNKIVVVSERVKDPLLLDVIKDVDFLLEKVAFKSQSLKKTYRRHTKRKCNWCGGEYMADNRNLKRGWGLCCSKSCAAKKRNYEKHQ